MTAWIAAHGWFLTFLALSVGSLALSLAVRQKWAAILGACILLNQLAYQGAIDAFDAPLSLSIPMLGDCLLALAIYRVYERHAPGVWAATMFLLQFTICLADWAAIGALSLPIDDHAQLLRGYYLSANVLWTLLVACNSGPGAKHVVVRLRDYLRRAGAVSSVARLFFRR